jgi:hypothetical protein
MRWTGHVTYMEHMGSRYTISVLKPEEMRPHRRHNRTCQARLVIGSCDGARLRLSTAAWLLLVLSPDESECDRVSERDRLGLTPNLTTIDLWRSMRWVRGNKNFVYSSLWDFKSSFTCCKILRHGNFPASLPIRE